MRYQLHSHLGHRPHGSAACAQPYNSIPGPGAVITADWLGRGQSPHIGRNGVRVVPDSKVEGRGQVLQEQVEGGEYVSAVALTLALTHARGWSHNSCCLPTLSTLYLESKMRGFSPLS